MKRREERYPLLNRILKGKWYRLTHEINRGLASGCLDMDGENRDLSNRGRGIVLACVAACANELCTRCSDEALLSEALRLELPSFLLDQIEQYDTLTEVEVATVKKAFRLAENSGILPLPLLPAKYSGAWEGEPSDPSDIKALRLAHELVGLRLLAVKKAQLRPALIAKGLDIGAVTSIRDGDYHVQDAVFQVDLAAISLIGQSPEMFRQALERALERVLEEFESHPGVRKAVVMRIASWDKKSKHLKHSLNPSDEGAKHRGESQASARGFQASSSPADNQQTCSAANPQRWKSLDSVAEERSALVNDYIARESQRTGKQVTKTQIWTAARYRSRTEFERWQRNDPKNVNHTANRKFMAILNPKKS